MKSQSELETGSLARCRLMYILKYGLATLRMGGAVESQRRAEPIRMRKEVRMEFLERDGWGSLKSCNGIWPYVLTMAFMAAC